MQLVDKYVIKKNNQTNLNPLIGNSQSIKELKDIINKVKMSNLNILITGETGTGKEIVARLIRKKLTSQPSEPFVAVDSATIQGSIAESILFGHEKGAFTGADRQQKGLFELANGGIIYFDEIANMPLDIQSKLLRVLQEKEIRRIGATYTMPLNFRIIAATNRNLAEMVQKGEFKADLYQRLNVLPINIKPLKDRTDDIPLLISHFLTKDITHKNELVFSNDVIRVFEKYSWPGNIRQLKNMVGFVSTMANNDVIDVDDLPNDLYVFAKSPEYQNSKEITGDFFSSSQKTYYDIVDEFENNFLKVAYSQENGRISTLARKLQMDRSHLTLKLINYGIHIPKAKMKDQEETQLETI